VIEPFILLRTSSNGPRALRAADRSSRPWPRLREIPSIPSYFPAFGSAICLRSPGCPRREAHFPAP